jgi:hypothetical protein
MDILRLIAAAGAIGLIVISGHVKPSPSSQSHAVSAAPPVLCPNGPGTCTVNLPSAK